MSLSASKRGVIAAVTRPPIAALWRPLVRDSIAVMMLHRFADDDTGVEGPSIAELRANLAYLRRNRFRIASFQDLLVSPDRGTRGGGPSIVFTIDDGYTDFARLAAPVFAEFDCPVTVFLSTGPVDRSTWFWWDQVEFVIRTTSRTAVQLELGGRAMSCRWKTPAERKRTVELITTSLKVVPNAEKALVISALADRLEVPIPPAPTPPYAAMSWDDVRRCARLGATFAPHTVNHPMLPQVSEAEAEWEIVESWRRLRAQCDATVPVFCYPDGAFTSREVAVLARTDLAAAVTTVPRYASAQAFDRENGTARFTIPRFAYPEDSAHFRALVTGFERLTLALRFGRDGWRPVGGGPASR